MIPENSIAREEREGDAAAWRVFGAGLLFASPGWTHDLGNSLQAAMLQADVLKLLLGNAASDQRATAVVTALQEQLERIHRLVSAWAELSVPGASGDLPFDLRVLLEDLERLVTVTLRHRGFTCELSGCDSALLIAGDRCALLHAALGLIVHLIETSSAGGRLMIRPTRVDDRTLRCVIAMIRPDGTAGSISTQLSSEVIDDQRAAQLGLAVIFSQRTIAQHHGQLEWRPLASAGEEFRFELPLNGGAAGTDSSSGR